MAWNDIYQDDNAVHLIITVGGHKYNFNKNGFVGTDIKVERKIGDTLSKFSLGIIDDGSDDYVQFERVILNRFTTINIEYGNSSKTVSKFTGFVVDYQPVFFGTSTKLTVTGYITRQTTGNTKAITNSSPYIYYIDWAPLVGERTNTRGDWDDIYNRNFFSMKVDSYGNDIEDKKLITEEEAKALIEEKMASLDMNYYSKEQLESQLLIRVKSLNQGQYNIFRKDYNSVVSSRPYSEIKSIKLTDEYSKSAIVEFIDGETVTISLDIKDDPFTAMIVDPYNNYVKVEYPDGTTEEITYDEYTAMFDPELPGLERLIQSYIIGDELYENIISYHENRMAYDQFYSAMMNLVNTDTVGNAAGRDYEIGHVPWQPSVINQYTGNVRFQTYSHPDYPNRQISRVVPDLFVPWDQDIPGAPEYLDEKGKPTSGSLTEFPKWVINDIKVFGLMFEYYEDIYKTNTGNPYAAYKLLEYDLHGVKRVYVANGTNYIWVGDCPELYTKWKNSNWDYNSGIKAEDTTLDKIKTKDFSLFTKYYKDDILYNQKGADQLGTVIVDEFKSGGEYVYNVERQYEVYNNAWDEAVDNGYIRSGDKWEGDKDYGVAFREQEIYDLEEDEEKGQKAISAKDRITQYLQAAYRSGKPLMYGKVYISDIVAQLCELEGWENPKIVATAATSYKSDFLSMNGMTALEYITQKLCPNAVEDGGTGKTGFKCFFDAKGRFHFEPEILTKTTSSISLGYNIPNSPVISFTVRSRGQLLMLGIDENVDQMNVITGDTISVSVNKQSMKMSETEASLDSLYTSKYAENPNYIPSFSSFTEGDRTMAQSRYNEWLSYKSEAQFFNMNLFNYYGYEPKLDEYINFIINSKLGTYDLPYGTSLIRKTYKSSGTSSTSATLEALAELNYLKSTAIKAELTMVGDNKIAPGQYITVINYTRRGKHYTSGDYYVQEITDNVTASAGFTQNLTLIRYGEKVSSMNDPRTSNDFYYIKSNTVHSRFEEGLDAYLEGGLSIESFDRYSKWFEETFPGSKLEINREDSDEYFDVNSTTPDGDKYGD